MTRTPKRIVAIATVLAACCLGAVSARADATNLAGLTGSVTISATTPAAQDFTPSATGQLVSVTLPLQGADQQQLTVAVEPTSDGAPTGAELGHAPLVLSGSAAAPSFVSVPFTGVTLQAGTAYAIVLSTNGGSVAWSANNNAAFAPGMTENVTDATPSWSPVDGTTMGFATAVLAASASVSVATDLTGTSIGLQSVVAPPLPAIQLSGTDQTTAPVQMPITVADATGTGAGWQLSVQTTPFATASGHHLPSDSLEFTVPATGTCASAAAGCVPASGTAATFTAAPGQPQPLFAARSGTGMGSQTVTPTVRVKVPAGAYAGHYTSDWTISISSGP